jgi:Rieske Fe-S protein
MSHLPQSPATGEIKELPRRSFLTRALTTLLGGLLALLPTIPAVLYFLDPLTRKKRAVGILGADPDGYFKITTVEALSADGAPRSFPVVADLQNFWNKFPDTEVGAVYLRKDPQSDEVTCFNARCPHLGCTVKYDDGSKTYVCPCHASAHPAEEHGHARLQGRRWQRAGALRKVPGRHPRESAGVERSLC